MKPISNWFAGASLLLTLSAAAADAPASTPVPYPLDNIPENLPFNLPYGPPISLDTAETVVSAAMVEAKRHNWPLNIAVVDSGAQLVLFKRMDGAMLGSIAVAEHKARTSAKFRRETRVFEEAIQRNGYNYVLTLDDVIASRGGIPLVAGGKLVGAIGCSGGTSSQDEVVCKAGAAALK
ncbi:MAG: heme-binding protein [Burkholderiales bacterium]|nr:heme-binding protein [Burkholderiales bacterium]